MSTRAHLCASISHQLARAGSTASRAVPNAASASPTRSQPKASTQASVTICKSRRSVCLIKPRRKKTALADHLPSQAAGLIHHLFLPFVSPLAFPLLEAFPLPLDLPRPFEPLLPPFVAGGEPFGGISRALASATAPGCIVRDLFRVSFRLGEVGAVRRSPITAT